MFNVHSLPASFGDSLLIEYGEDTDLHYILIDGGPYYAYADLISAIHNIAPTLKEIELLVITHIDIDHIDGIVKLLNQDALPFNINEVWFNGYKQLIELQEEDDDTLGAVQGEYLSYLIETKQLNHNTQFAGKAVMVKDNRNLPHITLKGGMELTVLGPGRDALKELIPVWEKEVLKKIEDIDAIGKRLEEDHRYEDDSDILGDFNIADLQDAIPTGDKSAANRSSIALIAAYDGTTCLLTGDTPSDLLLQSIEPILEDQGTDKLRINAWKLAHHGSKKSTLDMLMEKVKCKRILLSSDGKKYKHPDKETVAKLLRHSGPELELYFNYRTVHNDMWDDNDMKNRYSYETYYPNDLQTGITLKLD